MKRFPLLFAVLLLAACSRVAGTGFSEPDCGWLFTGKAPCTLVANAGGSEPVGVTLRTDLSLMSEDAAPIFSRILTPGPDSLVTIPLGRLEPGFYQICIADSITFNIGVRPEEVLSPPDAPADFDAFWEETFSQTRALPMDATFTPVPEYSDSVRACYRVSYSSWGGATAGGILSVPVAEGKYPVRLEYMGYGAEPFCYGPQDEPGLITFLVSVRGQGIFKEPEGGWFHRGVDSKENYYYRGAFADVLRAIDFVCSLDKADTGRIVSVGESQGGAFSLLSAAIDPRIKAVAPAVPFLGDYPDYARIVWWPVHEGLDEARAQGISDEDFLETLRYFDIKNFAPRIKCPVYMAWGLQDPTCPPHTNFAIYNNLGSSEKHYICIPTCGHAMWLEPAWPPVRNAFLSRFIAE